MRHIRVLASVGVAVSVAMLAFSAAPAGAADSPTYRDCSFVGGLDPDFVQLFGTRVDATVTPNQNSVQVLASESSDPMDSNGVVQLTASVSSPGVPTQKASASGTGRVVLTLPLVGSGVGRTYTLAWSAVFDSGGHPCPGTTLPTTTSGAPFSIRVVGSKSS